MEKDSIEQAAGSSGLLSTGWFDPIETAIRDRVRGFIETLVAAELDEALGCGRYRRAKTDGVERRAGFICWTADRWVELTTRRRYSGPN